MGAIEVTSRKRSQVGVGTQKRSSASVSPRTGGGGGGIKFSVEDGHILVITGPVSVENNDTIVL